MKVRQYQQLIGKDKKEIIKQLGQDANYYPSDCWFYILNKTWWGRIKVLILYFKDEKLERVKIKNCYGKIST